MLSQKHCNKRYTRSGSNSKRPPFKSEHLSLMTFWIALQKPPRPSHLPATAWPSVLQAPELPQPLMSTVSPKTDVFCFIAEIPGPLRALPKRREARLHPGHARLRPRRVHPARRLQEPRETRRSQGRRPRAQKELIAYLNTNIATSATGENALSISICARR